MPQLKHGFIIPTPEEDAKIAAGIAADPDTYEIPSHEIAQMRPLAELRMAPVTTTPHLAPDQEAPRGDEASP